jgi:hypothetical protein
LLIQSNSHQPITDSQGNVIAVLAPPANDPSYCESTKRACDRMTNEATKYHLQPDELTDEHRGSGFLALNVGLSYGNGHTKPSYRDLGRFQDLADSLLSDVDIQRLASYQDGKSTLQEKEERKKKNNY